MSELEVLVPKDIGTISFENWFEAYKPVKNPNNEASDGREYLYDTDPNDMLYVAAAFHADQYTVWTMIEEEDNFYIISDLHYVNRLGYFITEIPFMGNEQLTVCA